MTAPLQREMAKSPRGRVMAMDSAYHVEPANRDRDVVVNASYCGVLPARFIAAQRPRAAVGADCGVGPAGAAIAGLWYLEALNLPAAVADVMTVRLGDGEDLYSAGVVSFANRPAIDCGVRPGIAVREACALLLDNDPGDPAAAEVTNRIVVKSGSNGRNVICTDSIAFGLAEDVDNVLVTGGHTGRSALPYLLQVRPFGFICSDGGGGRDGSGTSALSAAAERGLAGATVDAKTARMGDGLSSYEDGIISAVNAVAAAAAVQIGMPARIAARLLLSRDVQLSINGLT